MESIPKRPMRFFTTRPHISPTHILIGPFLVMVLFFMACHDDNPPEPPPVLKADFSATPFEGNAPLTVQFTDKSTGSPTSWKWDFQGDGTVDALITDPSFIYDTPGYYDVKLVVGNGNAADSLTVFGYIYLNRDDVQLNYDGSISPGVGELVEIPVKSGVDEEFGAITVRLFYDNRLLEATSIEGAPAGSITSIDDKNGAIVIAWSSVNTLIIKENDELFRIRATIMTDIAPVSHYLRVGEGTEFADPSANIMAGIEMIVPYIDTGD